MVVSIFSLLRTNSKVFPRCSIADALKPNRRNKG